MKYSTEISKDYSSSSISLHNCSKNCPELEDLVTYSNNVGAYWKDIALQLSITEQRIVIIDHNYQCVEKKCFEMFKIWLQISVNPCWCQFIQALYVVRLDNVAEKAKRHLTLTESSKVDMYEGNDLFHCSM